jgi:hypothetical protein
MGTSTEAHKPGRNRSLMTDQDLLTTTQATLTQSKVVADYTDAKGKHTSRQFRPETCDKHGCRFSPVGV